jgi:acylphosphatase
MKRIVIIAKGEVQRVGYRDEVEKIARKLKISGFVENITPYDVRIVAEGEEDNTDQFIERIRIKKYPIDVEEIEVSFEGFKGEFKYFEIRRGEWHEELGERLDTAGKLLYKSVELGEKSVELSEKSVELSEKSVELSEKSVKLGEKTVGLSEESVNIGEKMLEKQDSMLEKQDLMLEKQDNTVAEIRNVSERIDEGKEDIVAEISSLREDLRPYMENKFAGIEREITEIKIKIGMV